MAAVIVPKNSAANAVPYDASILPNSPPYIKVTVSTCFQNEVLRSNKYEYIICEISIFESQKYKNKYYKNL